MLLPDGILKLNFDGSYLHSIRRGGIRGAIKDSASNVVRTLSGPVEASNVSEAEMFALLVGCWELLNLGGNLAIIKGFSAIQRGLGKTSHPWRLADWVVEVQDISIQLDASFHHIYCEAKEMADGLAKEEFFSTCISFDA